MQTRLSGGTLALAALAMGASVSWAGPFAEAPRGTLVQERVALDLAGRSREAERGRLVVPLTHGDPASPNIEIGYVRLFGDGGADPPVFFLSGGPGLAASRSVAPGRRLSELASLFLKHRDFIFIDQRGTGTASPILTCPETLDLPAAPAADEAAALAALQRASRRCARHWRDQGLDLDSFNTEENARDLDDLRRALGLQKILLVGASYGSHLAFSYLRHFEARVEGAILAGIEGPDHTLKLPLQIDALIDTIDREAPLPDGRSVRALVERISDRLAAAPAEIRLDGGGTVEVGLFDFQRALERATGVREVRRKGLAVLARLAEGDLDVLGKLALKLRRQRLNAMHYAMDCASGASPGRRERIAAEAPQAIAGRAASFPFPEICAAWDVAPLPAAFRAPFEAQVPVLMFSGTFDARTPVTNGEEMLAWFPNGRLVIVRGLGHDWCRSTSCFDLIETFLTAGTVPGPRVIELGLDGRAAE